MRWVHRICSLKMVLISIFNDFQVVRKDVAAQPQNPLTAYAFFFKETHVSSNHLAKKIRYIARRQRRLTKSNDSVARIPYTSGSLLAQHTILLRR
jgi:hypothetical protein